MRKGSDGDLPPDGEIGKLISGVFSDDPDLVSPADYAMQPGVPALMDELEPPRSISRRRLLLGIGSVAAVSCMGGVAIGWLGRGGRERGAEPLQSRLPRQELSAEDAVVLRGARAMASGPVSDLVKYHVGYLGAVVRFPSDPVLWEGVERLMQVALVDNGDEAMELADLLIKVCRSHECPSRLDSSLARLRAKLRSPRSGK